MIIRLAMPEDTDALWAILEPVLRAGETYALPRTMDRTSALTYWLSPEHEVFVAEADGHIVGTYYMRANQRGGGAHVANCGYMTAVEAMGRGIARTMCLHSLVHARARGFQGMQFNFVVSTNERAVRLWESLGFKIVGRLPDAFQHPILGYVDAFVMYRSLTVEPTI
ncbi:MAG TPA: GNAT family N-acetyltransferase [Gemmatimonadaceae bacterium]|nr:GNAT family N-acetyltransferase [Gemmatimonadaceae bacterium]